jgi:hypothetical protein
MIQDDIARQVEQNITGKTCWLMDADLFSQMFTVNIITAISYFIIPIFLITVLLVFRKLISWKYFVLGVLFFNFILFCGIGHIVKVYNFYWGNFKLEILIDSITAGLSAVTAILTLIATYQLLAKVHKAPETFLSNMKGAMALIGALHVINKEQTISKLSKNNQIVADGFDSEEPSLITIEQLRGTVVGELVKVNKGVYFMRIADEDNKVRFITVMLPNGKFGKQLHDVLEKVKILEGHLIEKLDNFKTYNIGDTLYYEPYIEHEPISKLFSIYLVTFKNKTNE